jgi:hypothetical protein
MWSRRDRTCGSLCSYTLIVVESHPGIDAYEALDPVAFAKVVQDNAAEIGRDENKGLVAQCEQALLRRKIRLLTQAYMTLSLSSIAREAQVASVVETERMLVSMIAEGQINATIDDETGVVTFLEEPATSVEKLMTDMDAAIKLG